MRKQTVVLLIIAAVLFFAIPPTYGEVTGSSEWNFSFDLPEGFVMTDSAGDTCYIFSGSEVPVDVLFKVYPEQTGKNVTDIFTLFNEQLGAKSKKIETFMWCGHEAAIAEVVFPIPESNGAYYTGLALVFKLSGEKNHYLAVTSYAEEEWANDFLPEIQSALDSVNPSQNELLTPGAITTFHFQTEKTKQYDIPLGNGKNVSVTLDTNAGKANSAVAVREFSVLTRYASSPLKMKAWERCYRMIYRDAFRRLEKPAFIISNAFRYAGTKVLSDTELAQAVLTWIQSFTYESKGGFDNFLSIPVALTEHRGDCDTRAVLMAIILKQTNIDTVMLLSEKAKHAMPAVDVPGAGARFPTKNGKKYLLAETTAHVNIGLIDSAISDVSLWKAFSFSD